MFASNGLKEYVSLCVFVAFFAVSNVQSQLTILSSVSCSSPQSSCGGSICYDPATQYCTELGKVVQCIGVCGSQCYNPRTQNCFNGTVCGLSEQLCVVKYDSSDGYPYNTTDYQCYNPTIEACLNNSLCEHPSRACNQQCLQDNQVCVNNVTVCNVTDSYDHYQADQIKLCNGVCYDSTIQQCVNGTVRCIDNCSDLCYNASSQLCFNETVCSLGEQLCAVKYDSWDGYQYNTTYYLCYNSTLEACLNNSLCEYPSGLCNQQCLRYNEVCVNNVTICNVTDWYDDYKVDQIQLCNGTCYDSAIQQCFNGTVGCINNCSGLCYNSSSRQCFNGTVCNLNETLCAVKYDSWYGYSYNTTEYICYNSTFEACLNNSLCEYPSGSCNQQCLRYNEVCVNNVTICSVTGSYYNYQANQIQLCNGVCYDSAIQQCVDQYVVHCIHDPFTQDCIHRNKGCFISFDPICILTITFFLLNAYT